MTTERNTPITRSTYIQSLPKKAQRKIQHAVKGILINNGITDGKELNEAVENAMCSRLSDIEELISFVQVYLLVNNVYIARWG